MKRTIGLGIAFPMAIYMAISLGYDSKYSNRWYQRDVFLSVYDNHRDITRYRVVGRVLVLRTADLLNHFHLALRTPGTHDGDVFTALVVVNGVGFIGLALLLYRRTAQRNGWLIPYLVMISLVAASAYVVTPYDQLSYVLTAALCFALFGARPRPPLVVGSLAVLGVATRESVFIGVAAGAAATIAGRALWTAQGRRVLAAIVGGGATYVALHVLLPHAPDGSSLFRPEPLAHNWNQGSVVAFLITALGALALYAAYPASNDPWWRQARLLLWLLSAPYMAVLYFGGLWFEAPRLAMPILLSEYLLRVASDERAEDCDPSLHTVAS